MAEPPSQRRDRVEPPPLLNERTSIWTWLVNPFHFVAGGKALAIGLAIVVLASVNGSVTNSHFDGVLDFHTGLPVPLWVFVAEGIIAWFVMATVLYAAGLRISKSHFRAIDVYGTQALARFPTLVTAFCALLPGFQRQSARLTVMNFETAHADVAAFATVVVATFLMIGWMIWLMFNAFSVSCNVRGARAVVAFNLALLLSEAISKIVLSLLFTKALG